MQCALAARGDGQAGPLPPPPGAPRSTRSLACCLLACCRFCYHERLSIAGNCRMCLVEVRCCLLRL